MKCSFCGKEIVGYGNSTSPLEGHKCCDECNIKIVMPVRCFIGTLEHRNYALLIKPDRVQLVQPDDKYFTLKELQTAVEGYIQVVPSIFTHYLDVVNEEGLLRRLKPNKIAGMLFHREYYGNVLICPKDIFEKLE